MTGRFTLLGPNGVYHSHTPGTIGGHRKLRIYGRLDCPSALRWITKGHYVLQRVFFRNEEDAVAAGYRPCKVCMTQWDIVPDLLDVADLVT